MNKSEKQMIIQLIKSKLCLYFLNSLQSVKQGLFHLD